MNQKTLTQKEKDCIAKFVKENLMVKSNEFTYSIAFRMKDGFYISVSVEKNGGESLKVSKANALQRVIDRAIAYHEAGEHELDVENIVKAYSK